MGWINDFDPVKFSESTFLVRGKPLKIYNSAREYLAGIYHFMAYKSPYTGVPVVFVKGRQVEMTTTVVNMVFYYLQQYPHLYALYTFPSAAQTKRFSEERLDAALRYKLRSDVLGLLSEGTATKNVKQFQNGSNLYVYGVTAEGGDNLRNMGVDLLVKDEYQDLDPLAEGNINEIIGHSEFKLNWILGTPKETGSTYEQMWDLSDKRYYFLPCQVCHKYFTISDLDDLVDYYNVRCPHCKSVDDKRNLIPKGQWQATEPGKKVVGFHLSQTYVPTATKEYIMGKIEFETQKGTDTVRYTKNEVLGQFYSGIKTRPTLSNISAGYDSKLPYNIYIPVTRKVYMGVDWGGSSSVTNDPSMCYTVATIGTWNDQGQLFINYMERVDNPDELKMAERVAQLMQLYRVNRCVADAGYGKIKNFQLKKQFGPDRFVTCRYLQGSASTLFVQKEPGVIHVNRDYALEELFADMGYGKIAIPDNENTEWTKQHFLNFEIENIVHGGTVYKHYGIVKRENAKTDAVHSINYLRMAALLDEKNADLKSPLGKEASNRIPRPQLVGRNGQYDASAIDARRVLMPGNRNLMPR